jgi:hypothetical protein
MNLEARRQSGGPHSRSDICDRQPFASGLRDALVGATARSLRQRQKRQCRKKLASERHKMIPPSTGGFRAERHQNTPEASVRRLREEPRQSGAVLHEV